MQVRPFLASAAGSAVAALALVLSEGSLAGAHMPGQSAGAGAPAHNSAHAPSSTVDNGASPDAAPGFDPTAANSGSASDEPSSDQAPSGQTASSGGIDPGSLVQKVVPVPAPVPIGP